MSAIKPSAGESHKAFEWLRAEADKPGAPIEATHALFAWNAAAADARRWRFFTGADDTDHDELHALARSLIEQIADAVKLGADRDRAMGMLASIKVELGLWPKRG